MKKTDGNNSTYDGPDAESLQQTPPEGPAQTANKTPNPKSRKRGTDVQDGLDDTVKTPGDMNDEEFKTMMNEYMQKLSKGLRI